MDQVSFLAGVQDVCPFCSREIEVFSCTCGACYQIVEKLEPGTISPDTAVKTVAEEYGKTGSLAGQTIFFWTESAGQIYIFRADGP